MMKLMPYITLFFLLVLTGCGVETAHAPDPTELQTRVEMIPAETPTRDLAPNTAVVFQQAGGIAGIEQEWTIHTGGRIQGPNNSEREVAPEEVEQLLERIEATGFFELNDAYLPEDTCCDRFFYTITVVNGSQVHTVKTLDGTPDMPEALQQTLSIIQTFIDNNDN